MKTRHWFAALVVCAACGGSKPATKSADPTTVKPSADAVLAIADLKFYIGDKLGMHLHADGRLEVASTSGGTGKPTTEAWQDIAVLKADGTITSAKSNETAHVAADGTITGPKGEVAKFKLDGAALVADGKRVTIGAGGVVDIGGKSDDKALRVEGANDAKTQRTALVIIALLME